MGLARRGYIANIQPGVVFQHGANAGQHRASPRPPGMPIGPRGRRGDPLAFTVGQGGGSIQRGGHLHPHPRCFAHHAAEEADVELEGFLRSVAHRDLNTCGFQTGKALSRYEWIRVGERSNHFCDSSCNQSVAAWACAPVVRARLQCHIGGCPLQVMPASLRITQGHDFCVGPSSTLCRSFAHYFASPRGDDAPYAGIGVGKKKRLGGEPKRLVNGGGRGNGHCAKDGSAVAICSSSRPPLPRPKGFSPRAHLCW